MIDDPMVRQWLRWAIAAIIERQSMPHVSGIHTESSLVTWDAHHNRSSMDRRDPSAYDTPMGELSPIDYSSVSVMMRGQGCT